MTPMEKFRQWLQDRTTRCAVCLTDEPSVKYWRDHPVLGRVFVCGSCIVVRSNQYGIGTSAEHGAAQTLARAVPALQPIMVKAKP